MCQQIGTSSFLIKSLKLENDEKIPDVSARCGHAVWL